MTVDVKHPASKREDGGLHVSQIVFRGKDWVCWTDGSDEEGWTAHMNDDGKHTMHDSVTASEAWGFMCGAMIGKDDGSWTAS